MLIYNSSNSELLLQPDGDDSSIFLSKLDEVLN